MRIDRLDLTAFGPFTGVSLDLTGGGEGGGLHLIYGPNEAGKSSALRAVKRFFCGIEPQSKDDFLHDYARMRIGAVLRGRQGVVETIVRRKGTKNTLLAPDGKALDDGDARLARLLGGVSPEEYVKKFVIDRDELKNGGDEVLKAGGDLGQLLFAAASGMAGLADVQRQLETEAELLFKKGGQKPRINAGLAELEKAKKAARDIALKGSEWLGHDQALRDARARKEALGAELLERERERGKLKRLADALGPIARRAGLLEELKGLAGVPRLANDFTYKRREALQRLGTDQTFEAETRRKIAELSGERDDIDVPGELLGQADAIEAIYLRHGEQQRAARDRNGLEFEHAGFAAEARALLRELGRDPSGLSLDDEAAALDPLRLKASDRAEIQELAASRQALMQTRDETAKALEKHAAKRAAAALKRDAVGPGRDAKALARAVKAAHKVGDVGAQREEARDALKRETRRAETALKSLGLWQGPLEDVDSLAVPSAETVERFEAEFLAMNADEADLRERLDALADDSHATAARLEHLRLSGEVPTEEALAEARGSRDGLWQDLRRAKAWDDTAAVAFESASRRADELADRLRREADRVAARAGLLAEQARQAAARDDLAARRDQARARRDDLDARWPALWSPLGISTPGTPREMLAWLRKHAKLADDARALREARARADALEALDSSHRRALAAALSALGEPAGDDGETLADRLERAGEAIAAVDAEASERKDVVKAADKLDADRSDVEEKAAAARAAWASWEERWAAAMAGAGQPADTPPAAAVAIAERTDRLFERVRQARDCRGKLDEAAREAARFEADVRALAGRCTCDVLLDGDDFDPGAVAADLHARLARAREARQQRDGLDRQIRDLRDAADIARDSVNETNALLATLRREARCESDDQLPAVEERSKRGQKAEEELAALKTTLLGLAAGAPLETFLAEASAVDADAIPPRAARLAERIDELGREREEVDQAIGREKSELDRMNGDSPAAEFGQEAEDLRARIRAEVEQYARLRLASAVLRAGIERYREKAHGPVVARASALFAALTLGSFRGLRVDYDDKDEPVLKGVRGGEGENGAGAGGAAVSVNGMSLGTADQLYLALRLASLESFLDRHDPLPLVVDDVLIQFDNARAAATLKALAALAARTQVLMFTHHEHLRDLALASVFPGRLVSHTLPGRGGVS